MVSVASCNGALVRGMEMLASSGMFYVRAGPCLEEARREIQVITAPLRCPQSLDKNLAPCCVRDNDPKRIVLLGKHLIYMLHSGGLTFNR